MAMARKHSELSSLIALGGRYEDKAVEKILSALKRSSGNISKAAELLKVSRSHLYSVLDKKRFKRLVLEARAGEL